MTINLYGICFVLSIFISFVVAGVILSRLKVPKNIILYSTLLTIVSMLYFSKLYSAAIGGFKANIWEAGTASLGGVIGLLISAVIIGLICKEYQKQIMQTYCLIIPLLYSISKVGCHFGGCCHGIKYNGPFAISYNNRIIVTGNVFPVQMAESITFMAIFVIGILLYFKLKSPYSIQLIIIMCAAGKFLLAYLREEQVGVIISANQIVCIVFAIWSAASIIRKRRATNAQS